MAIAKGLFSLCTTCIERAVLWGVFLEWDFKGERIDRQRGLPPASPLPGTVSRGVL